MTELQMWIALCAIGVMVTLAAERHSSTLAGAAGKLVAATAYIAAAWSLGAADTDYGSILLLGMAFCWLGDLFLVSNNRTFFLLGLASFLLGHVAYIGAFAVRGVSITMVLGAAVAMAVFCWGVLRWLNPNLDHQMRLPVWLYVLAIATMMAMAAGTYAANGNALIPLGAFLFLLSDLGVARDRFVAPGFINRAWGLPVYFCAQMILALSVMN